MSNLKDYLMQNIKKIILLILVMATISACKSKKTIIESIPITQPKDVALKSDIIINYRLDKKTIQDTFNIAISEALSESFSLPEYDIVMKLTKPGEAKVEIETKNILVVVPIHISVEKKTFIANLKAHGVLEMTFLTAFDIDSTWNLSTKTQLAHYNWMEKPKLGVGGMNIPIKYISDQVLKRSKTELENTLDQSIKDNFNLQQSMKETLAAFTQPQKFAPTLLAWIKFNPQQILLSSIKNSRFTSRGKIQINGITQFTTSQPVSDTKPTSLPQFQWSESIGDSSVLRIVSEIKTYDINTMLKENIEGKSFTSEGKTITLSNIVTNCDFEHIRVAADVSGTINGQILIIGLPKYDSESNKFKLNIVDMQLKTKNIFHKAVAWIGEGKIKSEIEKKLVFNIDDQVIEAQKSINAITKNLKDNYDMEANVKIGSIKIEKFNLTPGQIDATLISKMYIDVLINDLQKFGNMKF